MWWKWYMNKKNLISCVFILIVGIYWVVFDSAGQVVTLTILHLNVEYPNKRTRQQPTKERQTNSDAEFLQGRLELNDAHETLAQKKKQVHYTDMNRHRFTTTSL